ncbi:MAG: aspartate aminotransferase family protein [Myxococcales bacterium]|nr:aspartate aminotransferase family protein [Myxococcales bacterium]MCB9628800.1 aspartate aminotransferase family protein [Sandaracinaceae bacterium]
MIRRTAGELERMAVAERLFPTGTRAFTFEDDLNFMVARAYGSRLVDGSGNEYIDYLLGSGPHILGHAHPAVLNALAEVGRDGTSHLVIHESAIRLAEKIVEHVPCAEKVSLHNSGSEATFFALRLARAFRGRDKILKFEGGYHGMHDYALMSNQWTMGSPAYPRAVPNTHGIPRSLEAEVLVAPFNDLETTAAIIERHHDELAGVMVEPMQRSFPPHPLFLPGLRAITKNYGIPLIFDEVVTGFRLGLGGAQTRYGVVPDLCTTGKAISGGLPLGVLCGVGEIMELADPRRRLRMLPYTMQTGTYSSNPVCTGVACAVIAELEKGEVYTRMNAVGEALMDGLREAMREVGLSAKVCGDPTVFQIWFTDQEPRDHRSVAQADTLRHMRFSDLLLRAGVLKAAEKFFVSGAHTDDDVAQTLAAFRTAAHQLAEEA